MNELTKRIISGSIYAIVFLSCVFLSEKTYIALMLIFAGISLWEFSKLVKLKSVIPYILLPIIIFISLKYFKVRNLRFLAILTLLCLGQLIYYLYKKDKVYPKIFLDKLDLSIRYIILPFTFLILLPFVQGEYNPMMVVFIIVSIWVNDSFAYLVGKNFGKNKLFERISPKKTIEGFLGGLVFSIISGVVFAEYFHLFSLLSGVVMAVIISVFGTYGDLVESKFKRQANVKDSGNIMPGHGGILDRLDSLFFVAPFIYFYLGVIN